MYEFITETTLQATECLDSKLQCEIWETTSHCDVHLQLFIYLYMVNFYSIDNIEK